MPTPLDPVLRALRFDSPDTTGLHHINDATLRWCDRTHLTLELAHRCADALPHHLRDRVQRDAERNRERTRRMRVHLAEALTILSAHNLAPLVLKGFAHTPDFTASPARRPHYDIDLWLPRTEATMARDALTELGYESLQRMERFPTDHLPVLIRKTGYRWTGDWFDPDIPPMIDLHFRLWDRNTEGFDAPGWQNFWDRRVTRNADGFIALETADALGYATLHALRHLLRGSLRPYHVYEIASFVHARADDHAFWTGWRTQHEDQMRRLTVIVVAMAERWFGCRLNEALREEIAVLPEGVRAWLHRYAFAPLEGLFRANKHELWLHLELVESRRDAWRVLRNRLLPATLPEAGDSTALLPDSLVTWRVQAARILRRTARIGERAWHHLRVLPSVAAHGLAWWLRRGGIDPAFLRYVATTSTFAAGVFVFFVLYNLHLLGLGYREDFLGQVNAAMTAGTLVMTLPAGWIAERFGLRATIMSCIAGTAVVSALRAVLVSPAALLGTAFAEGVFLAGWAVQAMPAVAGFTTPQGRARAFSLFAAAGISMGVVGGQLGGRLPGWLMRAFGYDADESRLLAILVGAAVVLLALVPAWRLRFSRPERQTKSYPASGFIFRFLGALAVWHLATGAFKPFFNAWLARHVGAADSEIGSVFSAGQVTQVLALLAAPWILRRIGVIGGVAAMMAATGVILAANSMASSLTVAATGYVLYMAAQYMSEPGMFSLLMNRVPEGQRSGASAMNFLMVYSTHAIASLAAGWAYAQWSYPPVMAVAGLVGLLGGWLFWRLLRRFDD